MLERKTIVCGGVFAAVSLIFLTMYVAVQESERQAANDPQIQMAEDAASALNAGETLGAVVPGERIDVLKSLAPFIEVFDNAGKPVISSGYLNNVMPTLSSGVFDYVRNRGENRFTWQPESGVRDAAVMTRFNSGFVLVARSLREVEKRESRLLLEVFAGWVILWGTWGIGAHLLKKKAEK